MRDNLIGRRLSVRRWLFAAAIPLLAACAAHHEVAAPAVAAAETYGAWPTFLPTPTDQPDSMLTGSTARPALTAQGDTILVQLSSGTVQATVAGPQVPGEGLPYQGPTTTCTWTVTLTAASAAVPVRTADFVAIDQFGARYPLDVPPGQATPAATLNPGETVTFELRSTMKTGEGIINWAPEGALTVGSWDFVVEND